MQLRKPLPFPALLLALVVMQPSVPPPATSVVPSADSLVEVIVGTLFTTAGSLRSGTASLELVVGCGHALRTLQVSVTPETRINGREAAAFAGLHGHPVVEVRFRRLAGRNLAVAIDSWPPGGGP